MEALWGALGKGSFFYLMLSYFQSNFYPVAEPGGWGYSGTMDSDHILLIQ